MNSLSQKLLLSVALISGTAFGVLLAGCHRPDNAVMAANEGNHCGFAVTEKGERISWHSLPVRLTMHASLSPDFREALKAAVEKWNHALHRSVFTIQSAPTAAESHDANLVWFRTDGWTPLKNLALPTQAISAEQKIEQAITTVSRNRYAPAQIGQATVVLNGYSHSFFKTAPSDDQPQSHMESVLIHELGHVLGLVHSPNPASVMYESLGQGQIRTEIEPQTIDNMNCEYANESH